jgi:hypothetical protein
VVALLGLHFCIERFTVMDRMEKGMEFLDLAGIKRIPQKIKSEIEDQMRLRHTLRTLDNRTSRNNSQFGEIAAGILNEHKRQLQGLSEGRLNVPRDWKIIVYQKLMKHYKERFDAVSEDDLNYWANTETDAKDYLDIAESSFRQHGTKMTRIFVFNLSDLSRRCAQISMILKRQDQAGIGWAVAIREELPYDVRHGEIALDFALHNGNQAVSASRRRRRYETVFAKANPSELRIYQETYKDLIPACWLVSERFIETYKGVLPNQSLNETEIKELAEKRNRRLNGSAAETKDGIFLLVVSQPSETLAKIQTLAKLANNRLRPTRRAKPPTVLRKAS